MSLPVSVMPNFLTPVECAEWIDYINYLEQAEPEKFTVYNNDSNHRITLQLGEKRYEEEQVRPGFDTLSLEKQQAARQIFSRIIEQTGSIFSVSSPLYPAIFWLSKQYPGSKVELHEDTDGGADSHIHYSALVYLNTQRSGGELYFPSLNYTYAPQAGDLLIFDTVAAGIHGVERINEERYSLPLWMTRDKTYAL